MRIAALLFAAAAVEVWWAPLSLPAQSALLALGCVLALAWRAEVKRRYEAAVKTLGDLENAGTVRLIRDQREAAELFTRLLAADRHLTPENVAGRFRALLADVEGDDPDKTGGLR